MPSREPRNPDDSPTGGSGEARPPIVALAASAGGLEALVAFFKALPPETGAVYVVLFHILPGAESHLAEILGRATRLEIRAARDRIRLARDQVYLIPPNHDVALRGEMLRLRELSEETERRWPVDDFFQSLAEERGPRCAVVLLSGAGSTGVRGLGHVRAEGGLTVVQDPETATHKAMPQSAIQAGVVDVIAAPGAIPETLVDYFRRLDEVERAAAEEGAGPAFNTIISLLRVRRNRDFSRYKRATLTRRIHRRMGLAHCAGVEEYLELLRQDPEELDALASDLTIKVTSFFRDHEAWGVLENEVVAPLVETRVSGDEVRAWVPACATGEEAYSLAILLIEQATRAGKRLDLKIFATDADEAALQVARAGRYPEGAVAELSPERIERFFVVDNPLFQVKKALRECVIFSPQDLLHDPPFSRMDLLSCRNFLIYVEPDVQKRAIALFHFALVEGGGLFLGKTETVGGRTDLFEPISKEWRIYRRVGPTRRDQAGFPLLGGGSSLVYNEPVPRRLRRQRPAEWMEKLLLERYAPASVLVGEDFSIHYFHGATERFLRQPRGEPSQNLLAIAREGLRSPLRRLIRQASEGRKSSSLESKMETPGAPPERVRLSASPVGTRDDRGPYFLVIFEPVPARRASSPEPAGDPAEEGSVEELERDLQDTREELQSAIEELETSNEELKASNEEITSMNEELQSTNEELQTSKEELESVNEELSTVNAQLESKVEELETATNDLRNLLASSDVGTIFLDTQMQIRMFTPRATRMFDVLATDVGRPLRALQPKCRDDRLLADAAAVLESLVPREAEVVDAEGRWYLRRILPYRTEDNRIEGVVVSFSEITSLKRAEGDLTALAQQLEQRVEERTAHLRLLRDVATLANAALSPEQVFESVLSRVCEFNGWVLGQVYWAGERGRLEPGQAWSARSDDDARAGGIRELLGGKAFAPGDGLPGQVLSSGEARWSGDGGGAEDTRLARLRKAGVVANIAVPILVADDVAAVMEFFSERPIEPDDAQLDVMASIGTQLGRVVERARIERRLADLTLREQQRLGEELHEGLGQQVAGLAVLARSLDQRLAEADRPEAEVSRQLVDYLAAARAQVQDLAKGLMPVRVSERGLEELLRELVDDFCAGFGIDCRLEIDPAIQVTDERVANSLYRIAREAVNNAALHANPRNVRVRLTRDAGRLVLEVEDDGVGLPEGREPASGLGFQIMRDRAGLVGGELSVGRGRRRRGTRVRCVVPEGGGR